MKNKVMILAAAITLVACGGNQQKKTVTEEVKADAVKVDMHDAESSLDYQGTYTGFSRRRTARGSTCASR